MRERLPSSWGSVISVSYTHLDVYKRQALESAGKTAAADLPEHFKDYPAGRQAGRYHEADLG